MVLVGLLSMATPSRAELVYDNSENNLGVFLTEPNEFGDEISFAGTARTLSSIAISIVGETNLPPATTGRLRIYQLDGPPLASAPGIRSPGLLIYQSDEFPVRPGVFPLRILDLAVPVPNRIAWTIEFTGAGLLEGQRAGLQVYHPPVVGQSFRDYWVRTPTGFDLFLLNSGFAASFAARFEALPDPPVTLSPTLQPDGTAQLQLSGPIGSEHILEFSTDGNTITWRTLTLLSLATNATATFLDTVPGSASNRVYRTRQAPFPGQTCLIESISRLTNGAARLALVGSRNSRHMLEVSPNLIDWTPLDLIRLQGTTLAYQDPFAVGSAEPRFYRTRSSAEAQPLYQIQSIRREADRSVTVVCRRVFGPTSVLMQASTDLIHWVPIGSVRFTTPEATFRDGGAATLQRRFYRLLAN